MGTLRVLVNQNGGTWAGQFGVAGNQGNNWVSASVTIPAIDVLGVCSLFCNKVDMKSY